MARAWKLAYSAKIGMHKLAPAGQNRAGSNKRLCWKMADESADDSSDDKYDHGGGDSYNSQSASDSETSGSSSSFSEASNERPKRAKRRMKRKYDEDSCDSSDTCEPRKHKKRKIVKKKSLQRVSEYVTTACSQIDKIVRTDIPELRRPWFAEGHSDISSPLFLCISKEGVVYFTDDSQQSLSCYRQTPLPRKLISIAKGSVPFNDQGSPEDAVPFAPQSIPSDKGRWLSIAGVALTNDENHLLVGDSKLGSIRIVETVSRIAHHASWKTSLSKLKVIGNVQRFHPFAIRTGLPRDEQILITNPVVGVIYLCTLSADYTALTICRTLEGEDIFHPIDCLFFADNVIVVTDCLSTEAMSGEVKVMVIDHAATRKQFSFDSASGVKFPFGLCEVDGEVHFSDHLGHTVYKINFSKKSVCLALGKDDDPGQDDGPRESAKLCYPAGLAARGSCLYVAEHPSDIQGAIRMACSLQGLIRFQSTWREIAEGMGLVSKRVRSSDPEFAAKVRERTLAESLPELETAAQRLENIIEETRQYTGAVSLDISHGSMASRTAEGFYKTLVNGANYLREYFIHIGEDDLYDLVKVKALGTRMLEGFFGHITEKIQGNNPTFLEFTKHVATEAFHFIVPVVTSGLEHSQSVSVRRTRDEVSSTYTYTTEDHDSGSNSNQAMWTMFQQRHEQSFSTADLRKVKMNIQEGKEDEALMVGRQIYIGRMDCCRGYVEKLGNLPGTITAEQKANLRAIHMATKSRPMKSLRNFQKRKYGTAPTIIGRHASRPELAIAPIQERIFVSNAEQLESEDYHSHDGHNDGSLSTSYFVFEIGEVLVFRGTDGLSFNLLEITENVSAASIGPRSKLRGDFLVESSRDEVNIFFTIDPNWKGASMAYAHILLDSDDNAMTVCLDEAVTITETVYKMSLETYHEIQEIADEFEDSLTRALVPLHADDNEEHDGEEATAEPVEPEETLAYLDRRQRRGRACRYNDIMACLQ